MPRIKVMTCIYIAFALIMLAYVTMASYRLIKWDAYWFPTYLSQQLFADQDADNIEHLMFVVVDHYESGFQALEAVVANEKWLDEYEKAVASKSLQ